MTYRFFACHRQYSWILYFKINLVLHRIEFFFFIIKFTYECWYVVCNMVRLSSIWRNMEEFFSSFLLFGKSNDFITITSREEKADPFGFWEIQKDLWNHRLTSVTRLLVPIYIYLVEKMHNSIPCIIDTMRALATTTFISAVLRNIYFYWNKWFKNKRKCRGLQHNKIT